MIKLKKIYQCLMHPQFIKSYLNGVSPLFELMPIIKKLNKPKTLIDIGSNKGQFSILMKYYFPDIKIFSFEPIKEELYIQKKILSNNNIKFYNYALGNKNTNTYLNITSRKDSSSLLKPISRRDNRYKNIEKRLVRLSRLDDLINANSIKKPIILKLDIQGYELQALQGAINILKCTDYIISEISFVKIYQNQVTSKKLIDYLKSKKFNEKICCNNTYKNKLKYQSDILFVKK